MGVNQSKLFKKLDPDPQLGSIYRSGSANKDCGSTALVLGGDQSRYLGNSPCCVRGVSWPPLRGWPSRGCSSSLPPSSSSPPQDSPCSPPLPPSPTPLPRSLPAWWTSFCPSLWWTLSSSCSAWSCRPHCPHSELPE